LIVVRAAGERQKSTHGGLCSAGWLLPEADIPRGPAQARTRPCRPFKRQPRLLESERSSILAETVKSQDTNQLSIRDRQ